MLDSLKPGQMIRCTLTRDVHVTGAKSTIERLMRFNPDTKRRLKSAQIHRMQTLLVKSRGRRPWECREVSAKYAKVIRGASWTMAYFPHILPDMKSVEAYLKVEKA